jgi:hypothetical protein
LLEIAAPLISNWFQRAVVAAASCSTLNLPNSS